MNMKKNRCAPYLQVPRSLCWTIIFCRAWVRLVTYTLKQAFVRLPSIWDDGCQSGSCLGWSLRTSVPLLPYQTAKPIPLQTQDLRLINIIGRVEDTSSAPVGDTKRQGNMHKRQNKSRSQIPRSTAVYLSSRFQLRKINTLYPFDSIWIRKIYALLKQNRVMILELPHPKGIHQRPLSYRSIQVSRDFYSWPRYLLQCPLFSR